MSWRGWLSKGTCMQATWLRTWLRDNEAHFLWGIENPNCPWVTASFSSRVKRNLPVGHWIMACLAPRRCPLRSAECMTTRLHSDNPSLGHLPAFITTILLEVNTNDWLKWPWLPRPLYVVSLELGEDTQRARRKVGVAAGCLLLGHVIHQALIIASALPRWIEPIVGKSQQDRSEPSGKHKVKVIDPQRDPFIFDSTCQYLQQNESQALRKAIGAESGLLSQENEWGFNNQKVDLVCFFGRSMMTTWQRRGRVQNNSCWLDVFLSAWDSATCRAWLAILRSLLFNT